MNDKKLLIDRLCEDWVKFGSYKGERGTTKAAFYAGFCVALEFAAERAQVGARRLPKDGGGIVKFEYFVKKGSILNIEKEEDI